MSKYNQAVTNKVFSYNKIERKERNYSRKNFAATINKQVIFDSCIFQNTIFDHAKITQCRFINCIFIDFDFNRAQLTQNFFSKCKFSGILFYKCIFVDNEFEDCFFEKSFEYPWRRNLPFLQQENSKSRFAAKLDDALKEAILHKYIRESNTLFKKTKNRWPKSTKRALKKISVKDGDKMGWSKKQRLEENARRKQQRNELHRQNYEDSQKGKNRVLDKGVMSFFLLKYTEEELATGLRHCINMIDFRFNSISYLIKYIDQAKL